jgi:hypothetical protein
VKNQYDQKSYLLSIQIRYLKQKKCECIRKTKRQRNFVSLQQQQQKQKKNKEVEKKRNLYELLVLQEILFFFFI